MHTTRIVATANPLNSSSPDRNIPDIAIMTVMPETSTDRPEVAAAIASAVSRSRPRRRSSRSRCR